MKRHRSRQAPRPIAMVCHLKTWSEVRALAQFNGVFHGSLGKLATILKADPAQVWRAATHFGLRFKECPPCVVLELPRRRATKGNAR